MYHSHSHGPANFNKIPTASGLGLNIIADSLAILKNIDLDSSGEKPPHITLENSSYPIEHNLSRHRRMAFDVVCLALCS